MFTDRLLALQTEAQPQKAAPILMKSDILDAFYAAGKLIKPLTTWDSRLGTDKSSAFVLFKPSRSQVSCRYKPKNLLERKHQKFF